MLTTGQGNTLLNSNDGSRPEVSRREFLRVGGVGALGLSLAERLAHGEVVPASSERAVILLMLVGGPSQLETFDPKPSAPTEIRGPFGAIRTSLPGVHVNEYLPGIARRMDQLTVIRSLHHEAAPIHETGLQLIQTGRLCRLGQEHPHFGSVVARDLGAASDEPPFIVLPAAVGNTGVGVSHGQSAGLLGAEFDPFVVSADPASSRFQPLREALSPRYGRAFDLNLEGDLVRNRFGRTTFGQSCLLARRLVEAGAKVVVVNMYQTVFNRITWDCHGARPFSTLDDYRREVLPTFDQSFSALIDDLSESGRLDSTLVVATGEFGRSPKLNASGGRDHWPGVWSALMAGGGMAGGQVIGASDAHASAPADHPVAPAELLATMVRSLGIDPSQKLHLTDGTVATVCDANPLV